MKQINWPQAIVMVAFVAAGVALLITHTNVPGWVVTLIAPLILGPMGLTMPPGDPDKVRRG